MSRAAASYWRPQADRAHVPTWSSHQLLLSPKGWRPALRSIRHHDRARTHAVCRIVRGVPHCRRLHLRLSLLRLSGGCFRGCGTLQKASVPQHRERCGRKSLSRLSTSSQLSAQTTLLWGILSLPTLSLISHHDFVPRNASYNCVLVALRLHLKNVHEIIKTRAARKSIWHRLL